MGNIVVDKQPWEPIAERITNKVCKYLNVFQKGEKEMLAQRLAKAFAYSWEINKGHFRMNGDTNFEHIVKSLENLIVVKPDLETIELCLLHDALLVSHVSIEEIEKLFGKDVALLLTKYEKLRKIQMKNESKEEIDTLRQMLLVLADDVRVILVKLSSKLHGLESIEGLPRHRQIVNAKEVLDVYSPIASRLGVYALKVRLDDAAFRILRPVMYKEVQGQLDMLLKENEDIIEKCTLKIQDILREHKIHGDIKGRIKSVYSIAKKVRDKHITHAAELHDIFALRVLVDSKEDCYRLFGLIHEKYPPVPGKIKDYIALPKSNNYQSLHTTITEIYEKNVYRPVEVQIRTYDMNEIAEYGIASHSGYKEGVKRLSKAEEWQQKLANLNKHYAKKGRFSDEGTALSDLIDKIFVLTPKGDVKTLRKGSTPLDFAYMIHTDIGHRCIGAKVNGKVVPLSHTLQTGDAIEVITRKDHEPSATSLMYLKSQAAKSKLKAYLEEKKKDEYMKRGKTVLDEELKLLKKPPLDTKLSLLNAYIGTNSTMQEKESLLVSLGRGALKPFALLNKIFPGISKPASAPQKKKQVVAPKHDMHQLAFDGHGNVPYEYAKCCFPLGKKSLTPEMKSIGYLTLGAGIKLHLASCKHLQGKDPQRFISVT